MHFLNIFVETFNGTNNPSAHVQYFVTIALKMAKVLNSEQMNMMKLNHTDVKNIELGAF